MGQATGQLPDSLHFLSLDQCCLHSFLLGDLVRKYEKSKNFPFCRHFWYQRAAGEQGLSLTFHLVLIGDLLTAQGSTHRVAYLAIDMRADDVAYCPPSDSVFRVAIPVGVAFVGVLVDFVLVHVADQDGNGVIDQAQAFFTAPQGAGDAFIFLAGQPQVGIGIFELSGSTAHALFELDILVLGQVLDVTLFSDIAVQRDEALVRQRFAAQEQNPAVRPLPFRDVGRKVFSRCDTLGNLHFDVTRAVFAAHRVMANEAGKRGADVGQFFGKLEQYEERPVPRHQS